MTLTFCQKLFWALETFYLILIFSTIYEYEIGAIIIPTDVIIPMGVCQRGTVNIKNE